MVVDDECSFRRFVGELLHAHGIAKTVEARDGGEALQLFSVVKPGVVILDIDVPRTDSLEVLRGIHAQAPDVPVVMLTAIADEAVVERCVEGGATYFIRKDVPGRDFTREVRELFQEFATDPDAASPGVLEV